MNEYKITMPEGWKPRAHNNCDFCKKDLVCHKHFGICPLSHAVPVKEVEPLAVLADRLGYWIDTNRNRIMSVRIRVFKYQQTIGIHDGQLREPKEFSAPTYAAAEAKARAYLESLEDVK